MRQRWRCVNFHGGGYLQLLRRDKMAAVASGKLFTVPCLLVCSGKRGLASTPASKDCVGEWSRAGARSREHCCTGVKILRIQYWTGGDWWVMTASFACSDVRGGSLSLMTHVQTKSMNPSTVKPDGMTVFILHLARVMDFALHILLPFCFWNDSKLCIVFEHGALCNFEHVSLGGIEERLDAYRELRIDRFSDFFFQLLGKRC